MYCDALLRCDALMEYGLVIVSREVGVRLCLWVPDGPSGAWSSSLFADIPPVIASEGEEIDRQLRTVTLVLLTSQRKSWLGADCPVSLQVMHNKDPGGHT